jgi:RNA polymerase sigma-70 factor (ECF subfamily)
VHAQQAEGFDVVLRAIAEKRPGADRVLVDRFKVHVRRLLTRMLGPGPDIDDLMQEALFRVFERLHKVHPPDALPGFVTSVTVLVAREALRKRRRARWLSFFASDDLAELGRHHGSADIPEDVRSFYGALGKVSVHAQLCITLRYVEGMQLEELATALEMSLASAKRHLKKAEEELVALLGEDEAGVAPWLRGAVR